MTFTGVLEAIGKGFEKGLQWAVTYAVPVEKLVGLLFPAAAPELTVLADATGLIQNAVIEVEQKYAAAGVQSGTGTQKLATVMTLVGPVVTSLLAKAGIAGQAHRTFRVWSPPWWPSSMYRRCLRQPQHPELRPNRVPWTQVWVSEKKRERAWRWR